MASLLQELEAAREKASDLDQLSAAVRAIEAKAKVSGVMVQRVEVGGVGDFDDCTTMETIADKMLTDLVEGFRPVDERDRQGLVELLERLWQGISDYIAAIKARPITAERCDLTKLPMQWQDLRPYSHGSQRRITNGNGR